MYEKRNGNNVYLRQMESMDIRAQDWGKGVVKVRKAVCIQAVKVQVLCSRLRVASELSMTLVATA